MKNDIIPVYREGKYEKKYMLELKAKRYLKEKGAIMAERIDLFFTEYRLTPYK